MCTNIAFNLAVQNTGEIRAGSRTGAQETLYGLDLLIFNDEDKISEVIGFRQPQVIG